jgi:Enoyl-(Acyl carrier protein) reductase
MAKRGGGAIVKLSTMVADYGASGMSLYGSSKAAINLLTKAWTAEYGRSGVRVNAVSPGPTHTDGTDTMGEGLDRLAAEAPAGRPATADEMRKFHSGREARRGWRKNRHLIAEALFAPKRRFPFRVTRRPNNVVRHVAVGGDVACVRRPRFCRDRVRSLAQFPYQHHSANFDGPAPVCLTNAAFGLEDRPITMQLDDGAALNQPKQSQVIDAAERSLPIASEKIKRPPT